MLSMCRECEAFAAFFTPQTDRPFIIDCGSNIGVTMLEWKFRWPGADVICFEPDPMAFRLLQMNVERNGIPAVRCINAAVAAFDGTVSLYGDISVGGDARGSSIDSGWGSRPGSGEQQVKCERLSPYLKGRRVDFLKLDVEGAEEQILHEIKSTLHEVDAAYVEVHETDQTVETNSIERVIALLQNAGFTAERQLRDTEYALPPSQRNWQLRVNARQTQVLCWR